MTTLLMRPRELLVGVIGMATKIVEGVFYSMIREVVSYGAMVRYDPLYPRRGKKGRNKR